MLYRLLILAGLTILFGVSQAALAQQTTSRSAAQPALLIADSVNISPDKELIADGNVEVIYEGRRLRARSIIYDRDKDRLTIIGPITLQDGDYTTVLADQAELDRDLLNGILTGARIVMADQLQLAAAQVNQVEGRYSQLYKATVTSCQICRDGSPPLWQIRARRVIHDRETRQLFLDDAQFLIRGIPVFYFPRLRLPDPTLERATGFLIPSLSNSTLRGFGARVPYFIKIGDDKDLTLTPYISTKTRTLEFRYRQAFRRGEIEFNGAISNDDLGRRENRAYLFGTGVFELNRDFVLRFDIEAVNDNAYLVDYDYSSKDRLDSELSVERVRRDEWARAALTYFNSLRPGEQNSTLPGLVGAVNYEKRIFPASLGGELRFAAAAHNLQRSSSLTTDGVDFDVFADGRDVSRVTGSVDWLRSWTLVGGIRSSFQTGIAVDSFDIRQAGVTSDSSATEVTPTASLVLRWPFAKTTRTGVTHVVEPVVQLGWVGGSNPNVPNDESTRAELDEGNLLSLSRFAAPDRRERGASTAYGVVWSRTNPEGIESRFSLGQIYREKRQLETTGTQSFSNSSGLQGKFSDILIAGQVSTQNGLTLTARSLFDNAFDTTKAEARASWKNDKTDLGATYLWLGTDLAENRPGTISEWAFDGSYRLSRNWTGSAEWRYDVASDRSVNAGVGMTYTNECVEISLSASRRFTSSTILAPSTDISLTVGLRGFSTRTMDKSYVRTCRK